MNKQLWRALVREFQVTVFLCSLPDAVYRHVLATGQLVVNESALRSRSLPRVRAPRRPRYRSAHSALLDMLFIFTVIAGFGFSIGVIIGVCNLE